jgi:hypothetical protein
MPRSRFTKFHGGFGRVHSEVSEALVRQRDVPTVSF